jgi:hypothetical protein
MLWFVLDFAAFSAYTNFIEARVTGSIVMGRTAERLSWKWDILWEIPVVACFTAWRLLEVWHTAGQLFAQLASGWTATKILKKPPQLNIPQRVVSGEVLREKRPLYKEACLAKRLVGLLCTET